MSWRLGLQCAGVGRWWNLKWWSSVPEGILVLSEEIKVVLMGPQLVPLRVSCYKRARLALPVFWLFIM
jgi:hypothetical protein